MTVAPGLKPMIAWVLTDFPDPDSPTMAERLAGLDGERHALDGVHRAVVGVEGHPQVAHIEQGHDSKILQVIIVLPSVDRSILRRTSHGWRPPGWLLATGGRLMRRKPTS